MASKGSSKPTGYKVIDKACITCTHFFIERDYNSNLDYYCTYNSTYRPPCGSAAMHEQFPTNSDTAWQEAMDAWVSWSANRRVVPNGKCPKWSG